MEVVYPFSGEWSRKREVEFTEKFLSRKKRNINLGQLVEKRTYRVNPREP